MTQTPEEDILDAYHLARLAAWSGDYGFCLMQCQKILPSKYSRTLDASSHQGYDISTSRLRMIEYSTALLKNAIKSKGDDDVRSGMSGVQSHDEENLTLIVSKSIRGVIHFVEPVVFEFRAFPSQQSAGKRRRTMDKLKSLRDGTATQVAESDDNTGSDWIFGRAPYMRVEFTAIGQIRAIAFWCDPPNPSAVRERFFDLVRDIGAQ